MPAMTEPVGWRSPAGLVSESLHSACCCATWGGVGLARRESCSTHTTLLPCVRAPSPPTRTDTIDPSIQELEREARSALQLPADAALLWNRLRDELVCVAAEGQLPDAAAQHTALVKRIDYVTTRRGVGVLPAVRVSGGCVQVLG